MLPKRKLFFNGIDPVSGRYLQPPLTAQELAATVTLGRLPRVAEPRGRPMPRVDERDLATAGWGVVFTAGASDREREALEELLEFRRRQAGVRHRHYYREYTGDLGVQPGESREDWLLRLGVDAGPADPDQAPYYLLLVGDPESIPFDFQFGLGIQRAVGRLHLERLDDYRNYARKVVAAETSPPIRPRRVAFFGVDNRDDPGTTYLTEDLITPLIEQLRSRAGRRSREGQEDIVKRLRSKACGWQVEGILGPAATRKRLAKLLSGGDETPALLFTASHGLGPPEDDSPGDLGALVCGEWPGPVAWEGEIPPDFYFSADDLATAPDLSGLVSLHFACYSAGIPEEDSFDPPDVSGQRPKRRSCLSQLPQRLLALGAQAVIGHVDRAWCRSFLDPRDRRQIGTFSAMLEVLLRGMPVGFAAQYLSERYADLEPRVTRRLAELAAGRQIDHDAFARDWLALADARSYVVLGDPAVRLRSRRGLRAIRP